MSYSLPKYYFQDIHPDVMEEIMHGMQEALPEPSLEDLDNWLNNNIASTESWFRHPKFFLLGIQTGRPSHSRGKTGLS